MIGFELRSPAGPCHVYFWINSCYRTYHKVGHGGDQWCHAVLVCIWSCIPFWCHYQPWCSGIGQRCWNNKRLECINNSIYNRATPFSLRGFYLTAFTTSSQARTFEAKCETVPICIFLHLLFFYYDYVVTGRGIVKHAGLKKLLICEPHWQVEGQKIIK